LAIFIPPNPGVVGADRVGEDDASMIQDFLKFRRCFAASLRVQVRENTHIGRIEDLGLLKGVNETQVAASGSKERRIGRVSAEVDLHVWRLTLSPRVQFESLALGWYFKEDKQ
jgi:hypothetical protein